MDQTTPLFDECEQLVDQYNDFSSSTERLHRPYVYFGVISDRRLQDPAARAVAKFFETYTSQKLSADRLKTIVDSLDCPFDISQLENELIAQIPERLTELLAQIVASIDSQVSEFRTRFQELIRVPTDFIELIEVIFICMRQQGIASQIDMDENTRYFIAVGTDCLEIMLPYLSTEHVTRIRNMNAELKQCVFQAAPPNSSTERCDGPFANVRHCPR